MTYLLRGFAAMGYKPRLMGKRDRRNSNKMKQRKGQTKKKARLKRQAEARGAARKGTKKKK